MNEIKTKPDITETGNRPGRIPLSPEPFAREKPFTIGQVKLDGNNLKVYDASSQKYETIQNYKSRFGEYQCNGKDYILFEKINPSTRLTIYIICDSKGTRLKPETPESRLGKFVRPSGENMTFEKDKKIFIYDKNFIQIGNSRPK